MHEKALRCRVRASAVVIADFILKCAKCNTILSRKTHTSVTLDNRDKKTFSLHHACASAGTVVPGTGWCIRPYSDV
eukprot:scaffold578243_cov24-Prasinocladus_malaysianus.AAC.1